MKGGGRLISRMVGKPVTDTAYTSTCGGSSSAAAAPSTAKQACTNTKGSVIANSSSAVNTDAPPPYTDTAKSTKAETAGTSSA